MNEYYYGVGRVRSLEARLLNPGQIARMASAADFEAAFAVLSETPYAENLPKLKPAFDFEDLCELELLSLKDLLDHLAPDNEILSALFRKYDYLNIKILLRSLFKESKEINSFSKAGTIPFEKLKLYIFEGAKEIDEKEIVEAIDSAKSIYQQTSAPQNLDISLDQHYFAYLKQVASQSPSLLIQEMVDHQIDLANIKILLRAQNLKKDKKFLQQALLEPGRIDKDILLSLQDRNHSEIISRLSFTPYFPAISEGIESFARLEKLMDDYIIEKFRKAKYLSSGIEPLVGFYLAKEAEIKTLRSILTCKMSAVSSEQIKERIRVSY